MRGRLSVRLVLNSKGCRGPPWRWKPQARPPALPRTPHSAGPLITQTDLVHLVDQLPGLQLVLSTDCATVIASDGSPQPRFPVVFVAGVGLRCFDLRFAGWAFQEQVAAEPSLADELFSAA